MKQKKLPTGIAKKILTKMMKLNSLFGIGARYYANDPKLGIQFLKECHDQIILHEKIMITHLGNSVVKSIKEIFKNNNINTMD